MKFIIHWSSGYRSGSDGANSISAALSDHATLQHLDLANNSIGGLGVTALASAIANTHLRALSLRNNSFGGNNPKVNSVVWY